MPADIHADDYWIAATYAVAPYFPGDSLTLADRAVHQRWVPGDVSAHEVGRRAWARLTAAPAYEGTLLTVQVYYRSNDRVLLATVTGSAPVTEQMAAYEQAVEEARLIAARLAAAHDRVRSAAEHAMRGGQVSVEQVAAVAEGVVSREELLALLLQPGDRPEIIAEMSTRQVLDFLAEKGRPLEESTWCDYVAHAQAPQPLRHAEHGPLWDGYEIAEWVGERHDAA